MRARTRRSVGAWIAEDRELAAGEGERLRAYIEGFNAAPARRLSAEAFHAERGGADTPQSRPDRGYGPVAERLARDARAAGVKFHLNCAVASVRWRRGEVAVTAGRRRFIARAVVVTLPLGVLRADEVRFVPPLRDKQRTMRRLGWGHVFRITPQFRPDLWRSGLVPSALVRRGRARFGFLSTPGEEIPTWWAPDPSAPLLVGWVGGPRADPLLRLPPAAARRRVLAALAGAWQQPVRDIRAALLHSWHHDWSADRWTRGAYSYAVAGFGGGPALLAQPVEDTVFFAGEAASEELGTVHGAMASGAQAAQRVGRALGRRAG